MAVKVKSSVINNFIVDNYGDLASIDKSQCSFGDSVYIINEGHTYFLNSEGFWKKSKNVSSLISGGGSGGGSAPSGDDTSALTNDDIDYILDNN